MDNICAYYPRNGAVCQYVLPEKEFGEPKLPEKKSRGGGVRLTPLGGWRMFLCAARGESENFRSGTNACHANGGKVKTIIKRQNP